MSYFALCVLLEQACPLVLALITLFFVAIKTAWGKKRRHTHIVYLNFFQFFFQDVMHIQKHGLYGKKNMFNAKFPKWILVRSISTNDKSDTATYTVLHIFFAYGIVWTAPIKSFPHFICRICRRGHSLWIRTGRDMKSLTPDIWSFDISQMVFLSTLIWFFLRAIAPPIFAVKGASKLTLCKKPSLNGSVMCRKDILQILFTVCCNSKFDVTTTWHTLNLS